MISVQASCSDWPTTDGTLLSSATRSVLGGPDPEWPDPELPEPLSSPRPGLSLPAAPVGAAPLVEHSGAGPGVDEGAPATAPPGLAPPSDDGCSATISPAATRTSAANPARMAHGRRPRAPATRANGAA